MKEVAFLMSCEKWGGFQQAEMTWPCRTHGDLMVPAWKRPLDHEGKAFGTSIQYY